MNPRHELPLVAHMSYTLACTLPDLLEIRAPMVLNAVGVRRMLPPAFRRPLCNAKRALAAKAPKLGETMPKAGTLTGPIVG